jgi:hypothetical protein
MRRCPTGRREAECSGKHSGCGTLACGEQVGASGRDRRRPWPDSDGLLRRWHMAPLRALLHKRVRRDTSRSSITVELGLHHREGEVGLHLIHSSRGTHRPLVYGEEVAVSACSDFPPF